MNFFMGLLFSGVPIFIIAIIVDIAKTYKRDIEHKTEEKIIERTEVQKPIESDMKYYSSCGEKIKKTATFCEFCGSEQ